MLRLVNSRLVVDILYVNSFPRVQQIRACQVMKFYAYFDRDIKSLTLDSVKSLYIVSFHNSQQTKDKVYSTL